MSYKYLKYKKLYLKYKQKYLKLKDKINKSVHKIIDDTNFNKEFNEDVEKGIMKLELSHDLVKEKIKDKTFYDLVNKTEVTVAVKLIFLDNLYNQLYPDFLKSKLKNISI